MKTILLGFITVLTFATFISNVHAQVGGNEDNPRVPNVIDQFNKLKHHGEALGFYRGQTFGTSEELHYQGIVRKNGPGTPYLFLDQNGRDNGSWLPGRLSVIRMGSRGTDGERMRSNRLQPNQDIDGTPPPAEDVGVASLVFNGHNGIPAYAFPGGMQVIGNLLAVPMYNTPSLGVANCALVLIDVTNPEQPRPIRTNILQGSHAHAAAVTRLDDGRYLLAVLAGENGTQFDLYVTAGQTLRTGSFTYRMSYDASGVQVDNAENIFIGGFRTASGWPDGDDAYQMLNFVRDTNGDLFLIGTRKLVLDWSPDRDYVDLLSVQVNLEQNSFSLGFCGQIHQSLDSARSGRVGDNRGAAGVYVSPTGQLLLYTAEPESGGANSVRMGEIRNREVHTDPLKQPCGGWVELYEDNEGWINSGLDGGDRSIMLDYQDRDLQNLLDFDNTQGFGDEADSLSYFLLPGQWFELYPNPYFGGIPEVFHGTGRVEYVPRLDDRDGFGDEAHSIVIYGENNPPLIAFTSLSDGDILTSLPALEGAITDDFGPPVTTLTIQEINSPCGVDRSWNGTSWQSAPFKLPVTVDGETWTIPVESLPPLHSGLSYQLTVSATDQCGNTDTDTVTVSVPVTELTWDPGITHLGTEILNHSAELGGAWIFKITTQASLNGAWRTALNVLQGEAEVSMSPDYPALPGDAQYRSRRIGSDGWVLHSSQFAESQEWYLVVCADPGAQWNLVSGEVFIHELGTLAADASSGTNATMGAESMLFFRTSVPADTLAWRLWLNGAPNTLYVTKDQVPHPVSYELTQARQMLVVPPYLSSGSHFIGVTGKPGTPIAFDSRQQAVSDLAFVSDSDLTVEPGEFPYLTFRVVVPLQQIAWQLNLRPTNGDPGVALRRGQVPNEFRNDGFSDVTAPAGDSVTWVPPPVDAGENAPGLREGMYYVTVYSGGAYAASLTSGNPVITDVPFSANLINDDPNRSGWRYYRVPNISEQLNSLGWELNLLNHVHPGTEIALRRNAVPGSWTYRDADNEYAHDTFGYSDYSGTGGFLQRINHQADVWYVGIYTPDQALGNFNLDLHPIVPATVGVNGSNTAVTNLESGRWKFLRVDVPPGVLGWDLRVRDVTGGNPRIVVARDVLPSTFSTGWSPSGSDEWPSGESWTQQTDWTGRSYDPDETSVIHRRFVAGMGRPLEPGTYYVGVYNAAGAGQADFTLDSRGIGSGQILTVSNLEFASGSSATITNLAPREARYFKVTIPANTPSWEVTLDPTVGEMMLLVRRGAIPDPSYSANSGSTQSAAGSRQFRVKKNGPERHVILPPDDTEFLVPGDYYLAVVSEGQDPLDSDYIGTGSSSGTLVSQGSLVVPNLGAASVAGVNQLVSLAGGQTKAYQFTITSGTPSVEILLNNRVGNPQMAVVGGAGLPPGTGWFWPYQYGSEGGQLSGNPELLLDNQLITIANPPVGTYSITVSAAYDPESSWAPASATLRVQIAPPDEVAFNGGTSAVTEQQAQSWKYFRVEVPPGVLGWDLRLRDVTGGNPRMVVARDVLPSAIDTNWTPSESGQWPTGYMWTQSTDWTGRSYNSDEQSIAYHRFVAGMGRPLEPGTYYVGVYNADPSLASSFTLDSRGIGAGQFYTVSNLGFAAGSSATVTNLAPREARFFKVTVPVNTPSWEITLDPAVGEMMLIVRRGAIPDPSNPGSPGLTQSAEGSRQFRVQKDGPERHVILPPDDTEFLFPGDYYLAVVSEGQNPSSGTNTGIGNSSGTLTSRGSLLVPYLGAATVAGLSQAVSLAGAQMKGYQFTVPAGTASLEVRLNNRVGNPQMALVGGLRLPPGPILFWPYNYGSEGGQTSGTPHAVYDDNLITLTNPPAGTYTVTVSATPANDTGWNVYNPATADLLIQAVLPATIAYNGGTSAVTGQQAQSWKYFRVEVPPGVLGWDLRLRDVTGGNPRMVVARDVLPSAIDTNWTPSESGQWPSGYMWTQSTDWTGRSYDSDEQTMAYRRFVAGMGRPLEPGTYYVGVSNTDYSVTASYTLESRGIGAGQFYTVSNLGFAAGSSATVTNLAPREARFFKVTIPANTPSWEITLDPAVGEMMLMVRRGAIPDPSNPGSPGLTQSAEGSRQFRVQKDGPERHVILPPDDTEFLFPGDYYLAVVSEGQNPSSGTNTGIGNSSGTLTSRGSLLVPYLGAATVAGLSQAVSLAGAQMKGYQFTVAEGTATLEVRLNNRVGNPQMALVGGLRLPPGTQWFYPYGYGNEGGQTSGTPHVVSDDNLITMTDPPPGNYTITVNATYDIVGDSYDPATADLLVQAKLPFSLNFAASLNGNGNSNIDTRQVIDGERTLYAVPIPLTHAGQPVLGWKVNVSTTEGNAILRIYKNAGDTSPESMITVSSRNAIIVPPWLTPGETWYAEVEAQGSTEYSITSSPLELHRNPWAMPVTFNQNFGDSGLQNNGSPLPGDQGIDLTRDDWHFYAIDVPSGNGGLLRTELQAVSGNPDLYIREDGVPTIHHREHGATDGRTLIDRSLTGPNSEYGNWVPLDGRTETHLRNGRWYLGVKAGSTQNVRYRLKVSTGVVTDLNLAQTPMSGQTIVGGDWRYYRFTVPMNAPNQWLLTFSQQVGDVAMWLRDTVPPGDDAQSRPDDRIAWGTDQKNHDPYPFYDPAGTYTISTPQLRPGHTYFAGFRSNGDATFTISSSTAGGTIGTFPAVDFYNGTYSGMIPANQSTVVTVTAPSDASRWKHTATHSSGMDIRIEQGSLVTATGDAHYVNYVGDDSSLNVPLNSWPWVPGFTYFVRFVNTTGTPLPVGFVMNGANPATEDEDEDALPDAWENAYFGNTWQFDSGDDYDHDDLPNLIEFAFGLNPASGASLQLPRPQRVGANFVITFTEPEGLSGIIYGAQYGTSLNTGSWLSIPDTGSGRTHIFSVPIGTNPSLFMRLTVTTP